MLLLQSYEVDRSTEWCTGSPSCTWYPNNVGTECGKTVDALLQIGKPSGDPTSYFHNNQSCIAKASCNLRCKMDNCNWMKFVIPEFVNPYLDKAGDWSAIEAECAQRESNWLNERFCAEAMARHHIFTDLLPALQKYGCGSEADWEQVFGMISSCSQATFGSQVDRALASTPVYVYRQIVRASCSIARIAAGLSVDVNEDLRGKQCMP